MAYQVLARKWRSKNFQEVIGQSHITRSLQNAILKNKIAHAYMFVGTRGVGKTSVARIFAKAIRCENRMPDGNACNECKACLDFDTDTSMNVIEIDGASNNSVDNIRDLISNVHYLPTSGQFKVYIIDEVHMLSTSAFNALLKTLEEPPAHVVFIFATTEAQKLLGTVLSRCQRFDFRNAQVEDLISHIKSISQVENIKFENDRLIKELAILGQGSFRDTLSLLDQVLTFSEGNYITEEVFSTSLGVAGPSTLKKLSDNILAGDANIVRSIYEQLLFENIPLKNLVSGILDQLHVEIYTNKDFSEAELIWVYENLVKETSWIFSSIAPEKAVEVLLLKITKRRSFFGTSKSIKNTNNAENLEENDGVHASPEMEKKIVENSQVIDITQHKNDDWDGFLNFLRERSPASASNLEQGNLTKPIRRNGDAVHIELGFNFSGLVFLDYLKENEVFQKLINNLSEYFQVSKEQIYLVLIEVKSEEEFVSRAEIRKIEAENTELDLIEQFKKNPLLKEAEKIFNSKVDKVILETKNKE
jgi:DNA polymerase-3 subunit gamma/tau